MTNPANQSWNTPDANNSGYQPSQGPYGAGPAQPGPAQYGPVQSPAGAYGATAYPGQQPPVATGPKPNTMGIVALGLSALATVLYIVFAINAGVAVSQAMEDLRRIQQVPTPGETTPPVFDTSGTPAAGIWLSAWVLPGLLGLAGLIVGIIATVTDKGRWFGVGGIVLALVSPIVAVTIFFTSVAGSAI